MSEHDTTSIVLPASVMAELEMVEQSDWAEGVSLPELINWINHVVALYRPEETDSRSSPNFTPRSFRHYQTLGCIDSPTRQGKRAVYGFRHYLQALLVRKLLWERMSSEQIAKVLKGKTISDYKRLLFQGVEFVASTDGQASEGYSTEDWQRHLIAPGVELHLRREIAKLDDDTAIQSILEGIERHLRRAAEK